MSDRPILYSGPMVRAILLGLKTQTRRIVQLTDSGRVKEPNGRRNWHVSDPNAVLACPYGKVGDKLWVRESLRSFRVSETVYAAQYIADKALVRPAGDPQAIVRWQWKKPSLPSIHMPKSCCRIWLEITSVRLERLQEISATDILEEGAVIRSVNMHAFALVGENPKCPVSAFDGKAYVDLRSLWANGWDSINGNRAPWTANPWVWVIKFKRMEGEVPSE